MVYEPRGLTFDEFEEGQTFVCQRRTLTEADIVAFAGLSGDFNPLHTDKTFGVSTPFGGRIAHGMLVVSIATGQANQLGVFEGTTVALMEQSIRYVGAVKPGDTIHLELTVASKKETSKTDRGIVVVDTAVKNQEGKNVIEGQWTLMMARR
jgi:acyl dehydratase